MAGRLQGKKAVVTGAGQGIGRAAALALAAEGAAVWAVDREVSGLAGLAAEAPGMEVRRVDVMDGAAVTGLAADIGPIDVLFNCAGIVHDGTVLDCTEDEWNTAMDVNVTSMYRTIRAFLPAMVDAGGGSIINMSSVVSSVTGVPNRCAYGASKAAVVGLTKAVAADFVSAGIRCNAICPGTVDTPSLAQRIAAGGDPEGVRAAFVARQPMGRLGTAGEIAALAVYLASDEAGYTTGAIHVIDGGMAL